jgi:hypothetical protein
MLRLGYRRDLHGRRSLKQQALGSIEETFSFSQPTFITVLLREANPISKRSVLNRCRREPEAFVLLTNDNNRVRKVVDDSIRKSRYSSHYPSIALDEKGRSSFQLLQGFDMGQEKPPIVYYAFDLLRRKGKNLQNLPIEERKAKLEELLKKPPGVVRYSISFTKDIPELLERAGKLGLEGLIGKRGGPRYEVGKRSGSLDQG